jgi:hypothetical protein
MTLVLAGGCDSGLALAGDEDGVDATDDARDDGGAVDTPDGDATDGGSCPAAWPTPGSFCVGDLSCEYGSETCCGATHPSFVCQCSGGVFGCYYTDACMGAPFSCPCVRAADCPAGVAWCEGGHCVACDNSGMDCGIYCPDGFVPSRNGCQPCACNPPECEMVGEGYCTCDAGCGEPGLLCEVGLGRCIRDRCATLDCLVTCDPLRGCVAHDCTTAADCKLIYSSCSCQAVPATDPRTSLDPCLYDGNAECRSNSCIVDGVLADCRGNLCVERYPPGCGG